MNRIVRTGRKYRRRREVCRSCANVIVTDPPTDGCTYGWHPDCGQCYPCTLYDLFGEAMQPDEGWWRAVRRLVRAARGV